MNKLINKYLVGVCLVYHGRGSVIRLGITGTKTIN